MEWLSSKKAYKGLQEAVPITFFAAALTAILACMTGYWLSAGGEYDPVTLNRHKWMGIFTALISSVAYILKKQYVPFPGVDKVYRVFCISLFFMITITGHLGGSLTHGSGYLVKGLPVSVKKSLGIVSEEITEAPIGDVQEALAYKDLVARVFQKKCTGCHGPSKQKGGLRLDGPDWIMKGGKNGKVLVNGDPDESELIKRLLLPEEDEDHMPPKEKNQLSDKELELLHWWISQGTDFEKRVKDYAQNDTIKTMLVSFQSKSGNTGASSILPVEATSPAPASLIDSLKKMGVLIQTLAPGSNYLSASFINLKNSADSVMPFIARLNSQLLILKLSGTGITDTALKYVSGLTRLKRLYLDRTTVSDTGIVTIGILSDLQYLNLVGTRVSANGIKQLNGLTALRTLYLYQSEVKTGEYQEIIKLFPKTYVDTGGYIVPILASDTTEFKPPKEAKKKKQATD